MDRSELAHLEKAQFHRDLSRRTKDFLFPALLSFPSELIGIVAHYGATFSVEWREWRDRKPEWDSFEHQFGSADVLDAKCFNVLFTFKASWKSKCPDEELMDCLSGGIFRRRNRCEWRYRPEEILPNLPTDSYYYCDKRRCFVAIHRTDPLFGELKLLADVF